MYSFHCTTQPKRFEAFKRNFPVFFSPEIDSHSTDPAVFSADNKAPTPGFPGTFPGSGARWPAPRAVGLVHPQAGLSQGWGPGREPPPLPSPGGPGVPTVCPPPPRPLLGPGRHRAPGPPASRDHSPYFGGGIPHPQLWVGPQQPHPEHHHLC